MDVTSISNNQSIDINTLNASAEEEQPAADTSAKASRAYSGNLMSRQARELYASRMGIDPELIPALTGDVAALKEEFRAMYAVAGGDARQAGEASKAFLAELSKLKTLAGLLARSVAAAFIGKIRKDIESLRKVIM